MLMINTLTYSLPYSLQLQGQGAGGPVYNGPIDVVRQLYKEGGLRSIWRGSGATLARDGPGSAA